MKHAFLFLVFVAALTCHPALAGDTGNVTNEFAALIDKINGDIRAGKHTEADFSEDIKQFDAFLAEHKKEKTDFMAMAWLNKAALYSDIIGDTNKGGAMTKRIEYNFKDTAVIRELKKEEADQAAREKAREALKYGTVFPDFDEKDVLGKPMSVSSYKGKVVLVDFWATWCVPCQMQLPGVIDTYQKYHDKGFEVIGVSLDIDQPTLLKFIQQANMPWPEYYDGLRFDNKLAIKYGIEGIPMNYLLDRDGKIIGKDLRGGDLPAMVANALAK